MDTVLDLAHDYLDLDGLFTADELALRDRVRAFVDERIRPNIAEWYATATFPRELVKEMAALGLLGMRERARILGGDLAVVSAPGAGTRVTLTLPLAGPPEAAPTPPAP